MAVNYGNMEINMSLDGSVNGEVQDSPTGGTTNYHRLINKPEVNGVELDGDLSTEQIKVTLRKTKEEWDAMPSLLSISGTAYVYTNYRQIEDPETHEITYIPRVKYGDGTTLLIDLPFSTSSITDDDLEKWNTSPRNVSELEDTNISNLQDGDVFIYDENDNKWKNAPSGSAQLTNDLQTSMTVGGVESGTNYQRGTQLEKIFRDMLDPILYPTLVNPSVSAVASGSLLLEKGTSKNDIITATFNRGSITPAYGTSGYRSGEVELYRINDGNAQRPNTFTVAVDALHRFFTVTASYAAGEQPKDSEGHDYDSPLPAGIVMSDTIIYTFVEALWANTINPSVINKLPLIEKTEGMVTLTFAPCSSENPETFDIPTSWNVTAVEVKNDLTSMFDDCLVEFSTSDVQHSDAGGTSIAYTRYECNLGYDMGSRTIRVKWT